MIFVLYLFCYLWAHKKDKINHAHIYYHYCIRYTKKYKNYYYSWQEVSKQIIFEIFIYNLCTFYNNFLWLFFLSFWSLSKLETSFYKILLNSWQKNPKSSCVLPITTLYFSSTMSFFLCLSHGFHVFPTRTKYHENWKSHANVFLNLYATSSFVRT